MLKYGNRDFRNLQEQVYANMKNIEDIIKGQDIIADYTLQIVGQVDSAKDLPDAETYDGKLGDIYVVGEASPFHGYAFVKVYENENVPSWVDLGAILVQGPQGEQGPIGPEGPIGPQGDQGVPAGFGVPTASIQGTTGTPNVSITASGPNTARVFDFTFYNLKGEKGDTGLPGAGVPEIQTTDAGKALIVDQQGEVAEWTELPSGLPDIEAGDAGKLLAVNSAETGAEWVADDSLKLPESAPAAQQLVGINTSGEQNALGIGEGFGTANNTIELYHVIDFNNSTVLKSESEAAILNSNTYRYIKIINYSSDHLTLYFKLQTAYLTPSSTTGSSANILGETPKYIFDAGSDVVMSSANGYAPGSGLNFGNMYGFYAYLFIDSSNAISIKQGKRNNTGDCGIQAGSSKKLDLAGGTLSTNDKPNLYPNDYIRATDSIAYCVWDTTNENVIIMKIYKFDFKNNLVYIRGEDIDSTTGARVALYTGVINKSTGVYTITKHSA